VLRPGALLLALLLAAPAAAQAPRPLVQRQGAARVSTPPGRGVTAAFLVSPASPAGATVHAEVEAPEGWRAVAGGGSLRVGPGERRMQLVSVAVPATAAAGTYFVHLAARSGYATGRDSVRVEVSEHRGLAVRLVAAPRFAPAGGAYAADFLVTNTGNVESRVRLAARGSHGLPARADSALLRLAPGGSREVRVSVSTRGVDHGLVHEVRLVASDAADTVSAAASGRVELVPGGSARPGRIPAELAVHAAALGGPGIPLSLAGSGALPGGSGMRVDFDFRGGGAGLVGGTSADRYAARLRGRGFDLFLGDQLYTLSPLTEPGRPGFGAGGRWSAGRWSVSGFGQRDRRLPGEAPRYGASLGYAAGPATLSFNALSVPGEGLAATARALLHPFRIAALDLEYGRGTDGAETGGAYSLRLSGSTPWLAYALLRSRADAGFPAPDGVAAQDRASVRLQPGGGFYLSGSASRYAADPYARGALGGWAATGESWRVGAGHGGGFSAEFRRELRSGTGLVSVPELETRALALRASRTLGPLTLSPHAEVGTAGDPRGRPGPLRTLGLWSALRLGGGGSVSAGVERRLGTAGGGALSDRVRGSADATLRAGGATTLRLSARGELDRRGGEDGDRGVDAEVERQLPGGHRLVARVRTAWREGGFARAPLFLLDYVVPLRVPVPRRLAGGRASGVVVDAADGRGVEGVLLRLGGRATVTDRHGRWSLEGLPAGAHFLEVDRLSLGLDRIPDVALPLRVVVADGRTARVDLRLARSTRVLGNVRRAPSHAGEAGVEVTLSRGGERHRQTTDAWGRFDFPDLAPGRWLLAARHPALPANHSLAPDTVALELAPGERREVSLRVVPRVRPVRIIAGGEVRVEAETPRERPAAPRPRTRPARKD